MKKKMVKSKYCGITGDELANMLNKPNKYSKKEAEEIIEKAEELSPLEELGFLKGYILDSSSIYFDMLVKKFEIIETALKEKEKQDKALEIIRRDPEVIIDTINLYDDWEAYKEDCDYENVTTAPFNSEDEFNLAKEVVKGHEIH